MISILQGAVKNRCHAFEGGSAKRDGLRDFETEIKNAKGKIRSLVSLWWLIAVSLQHCECFVVVVHDW